MLSEFEDPTLWDSDNIFFELALNPEQKKRSESKMSVTESDIFSSICSFRMLIGIIL